MATIDIVLIKRGAIKSDLDVAQQHPGSLRFSRRRCAAAADSRPQWTPLVRSSLFLCAAFQLAMEEL